MTTTVILYIGFSLCNCLEKTTQMVWKTWKTQGISFCQICKHPDLAMSSMTSMLVDHNDHIETTHARVATDASDLQRVHQWFNTHDPFVVSDGKLRSISSSVTANDDDNITCDMAEKVGCEIQKSMDDKMFANVTLPKANQTHTLARLQNAGHDGTRKRNTTAAQ